MNQTSFLLVQNLSFQFEDRPILTDINFSMEEGSFTSILGDSGSGKSTLLNILAGVLKARSGRIQVGGDIWQEDSNRFLAIQRRSIAFIFQQNSLFPHKNVQDNILLAHPRRSDIRNHQAHFDKVVQMTGLGAFLRRFPAQLSGGQQQRVAIARALYSTPRLILMDEPFSALDAKLAEGLRADLQAWLRDFQMTAILVTHHQKEALQLSDQVGLLVDGQLLQMASPEEIYFSPNSQAVAERLGEGVLVKLKQMDGKIWHEDFGVLDLGLRPFFENAKLFIRSQDLQLDEHFDSGDPGKLAIVVQRFFRGTDYLYQLKSESGSVYLCASPHVFEIGTRLQMRFHSKNPAIF